MAASTGVRCLFGSYVKQFYLNAHLSRPFYFMKDNSTPKYITSVSFITHSQRRHSTYFNNLSSSSFSKCLIDKVHSRNESTALKTDEAVSGCPICSRNLTFTYKDVLLLAQFISPEGNILNRRITGVCRKQQRKLEKAIEISRRLGLIPRKPPALIQKQDKM